MTSQPDPTPTRISPRPWMTAPETRAVMTALEAAGGAGCVRFVGGCVRDALLDRDGAGMDVDIATPLTPVEVTAALRRAGLKAVPTGIAHGTVTAVAPDADGRGRPFEITTLRRDVETDGRRAVVAFSTDWGEDAARRDFRLNALYLSPDGALHDPTGAGVTDALAGLIVFVGDPMARIREDYLRVLRFFRFYAGYGRGPADAAALEACAALKDGVAGLSGERVAKELLRLLAAADPRPALALMGETGVLGVALPWTAGLGRLDGLVTVETVAGAAPDPVLRLAALLPDDRAAVTAAAGRLRLANALRDRLLAACSDAIPIEAEMPSQVVRAAVYRLGAQAAADRLMLAWAQAPSSDAGPWTAALAIARGWTPPPFPVTGADIRAAGVAEGPEVGAIRREIEAWWVAKDFPADPPAVVARLRSAVAARR